jgi:hypothetical protein
MISRESRNENPEQQDSNKWVKKLQQESWELELLVSGFSIVLLSKLTGWLQIVLENINNGLNPDLNLSLGLVFFVMLVLLASYALIANLIIHLLFRGFWVGIVGLGSVAPTTDFQKLRFSKFFTKKLEKRVAKLDDLVITVDKISSLIFTFAFLLIFFLISIGLFLSSVLLLTEFGNILINSTNGALSDIVRYISYTVVFSFFIAGIIYMIDFFTMGFFKKYKWLSKIYYPFYVLFGWITLSFLYRTLYYNLISKFSKRKVGLILIPYLLIIIMVPFVSFDHHIFYPEASTSSHIINHYYSDIRENDEYIYVVDIPSYIVEKSFIPLFIAYSPKDNELIKEANPKLEPLKNEGFNSNLRIRKSDRGGLYISNSNRITNQEETLKALIGLYKIYLNDSLLINPEFYFETNKNKNEKGIVTIIDIYDLPRGKNIIKIQKLTSSDSLKIFEDYACIPFWKD